MSQSKLHIFRLLEIGDLFAAELEGARSHLNLNLTQIQICYTLLQEGVPMTSTSIASSLASPLTRVSNQLKLLEAMKIVWKVPASKSMQVDRRSHLITLTAEGRAAAKYIYQYGSSIDKKMREKFSVKWLEELARVQNRIKADRDRK